MQLIFSIFNFWRMKTINKAPSENDKVSWWYWFEKLDGNRAKCKNCDWLRDRGPAKSTSILRCHLKSKHSELYDQRMEAQAVTPNPEQRGRKRRITTNASGAAPLQQQQPKQRRQVRVTHAETDEDIVKKTLSFLSTDAFDLHDDSDDGIDNSSPKFALRPATATDQPIDERQTSNNCNLNSDEVDFDDETLKQNLELSQAMFTAFMHTLGGDNNSGAAGITNHTNGGYHHHQQQQDGNRNKQQLWANKKQRHTSTASAVDLGFVGASTAATTSASSTLSSRMVNNNSNNLPAPFNSLTMFVPPSAAAADAQRQQQQQPIVKMFREEKFSAAHRLHNGSLPDYLNREMFGKCNNGNGHGHNYTWKVALKGPVDQHTGMVYNLADLKREMQEVLEQVDHKHLDKDVPYFRDNGIVSTTENLCVFLYNELFARMSCPALLHKVVVCETDKNCFSFAGYSS